MFVMLGTVPWFPPVGLRGVSSFFSWDAQGMILIVLHGNFYARHESLVPPRWRTSTRRLRSLLFFVLAGVGAVRGGGAPGSVPR